MRIMAELADPGAVLAAIDALRGREARVLDVYSPYPVREIEAALGISRSRIPYLAGLGGLAGGAGAYFLQWWMNAYDYPLDVGGRPPHMPSAFVPVTFEMAVLLAALTIFVAVLALSGLPRLWHPVFEVDGFETTSVDRFWLAVEAPGNASLPELEQALLASGALRVVESVHA
jgi:hypothetical protein